MGKIDQQNLCKGKNKQGKPCRAAATAGGLCFFHANPNKASELGRIGGRKNGHFSSPEGDTLPPLNNTMAIRDTLTRVINEMYTGRLDPRVGAALGPLLNLQLRAIGGVELEQRIAALEQASKLEGEADTPEARRSQPDE